MKLNSSGLEKTELWEKEGFELPQYDRARIVKNTEKAPEWIHFGAGNIFRAFIAELQQEALNSGEAETGIIAAEGYDYEIIDRVYHAHDNLSVLVTLKNGGSVTKTVVGSVTESLKADSAEKADWERLKKIFRAPSLQLASFTITEKGYSLVDGGGEFLPEVLSDFENGPESPRCYIGKIVSLLFERYASGELPLALVSMDNCSHNGEKLCRAVTGIAEKWCSAGFVSKEFIGYLNDRKKISFPWSMIDKITPRPDNIVKSLLEDCGLEDAESFVTSKNTYIAPFVNAEETQYLVIEDCFPNGRPKLEKVGVMFSDRETVEKVERMKVCTCLNPLHTALAIFGCLLGYDRISHEMDDPQLRSLVEAIGYREGLPVVTDPGIIDPKKFIDTVVNVRMPNRFMPDSPQRIASDTSQKMSIRFGETLKMYMATPGLDIESLVCIPLTLAGWVRYIMGIDDNGESFEPSPDPLLAENREYVKNIKLGEKRNFHVELEHIFSNSAIFGVNLYEAGLGEKCEGYFAELAAGKGSVRRTLEKYTSK